MPEDSYSEWLDIAILSGESGSLWSAWNSFNRQCSMVLGKLTSKKRNHSCFSLEVGTVVACIVCAPWNHVFMLLPSSPLAGQEIWNKPVSQAMVSAKGCRICSVAIWPLMVWVCLDTFGVQSSEPLCFTLMEWCFQVGHIFFLLGLPDISYNHDFSWFLALSTHFPCSAMSHLQELFSNTSPRKLSGKATRSKGTCKSVVNALGALI